MGIRVLALVTEAFGGHGGIALYNRDMLTALCEQPDVDEVVVIPRLLPETPPVGYPDKITCLTNGPEGKINYIRTVLSILKQRPKFDLILCAHINLLPVSHLAAVKSGAIQILGIYGIDAWQPTASRLTNFLTRRLRHFYVISEITKRRFLTWSGLAEESGFLLPNAIHTEWYGLADKNPGLVQQYALAGKKVVMTLGRLLASERYKGVDEILDVMPELIQAETNIHYLVVGDGDDRIRLEKKAEALGVAAHVTFIGRIEEADKADCFRLADAYVMPSYGEGFGFVFLEAMACGIPVVASETDGGREAVRGGELGLLVDPANPQQLRDAILTALGKPKGIPPGVEYFSFTAFKNRAGNMLKTIGVLDAV